MSNILKFSNFKTKLKKSAVIGGIAFAILIIGKALLDEKSESNDNTKKTFWSYRAKLKTITPFLIADLIAKEGVNVNKDGMHIPYLCSMGVPTIGFGSTMLKDGSRVTMKTKPITTDAAYELARWHLEDGESYFLMYCYDTACDEIDIKTASEALGVGSIVFNSYSKLIEDPGDKNHRERFAALRKSYKEFGFGITDSIVLECFTRYPIKNTRSFGEKWISGAADTEIANSLGEFLAGGNGLSWRRWLEAGLFTGDITPDMLLECPVNGMYEFYMKMGGGKKAFVSGDVGSREINKKTYSEFKKWLDAPTDKNGNSISSWKKVKNWLPPEILELCQNGKCELGDSDFIQPTENQKQQENKTYVFEYADAYESAISAHKSGDYKLASERFKTCIEMHPNNALLRNDLSDTYNKMERYDDAIDQAREILMRIGDKSQYAAANFNAGYAYEKKGNLQKALANYKRSVANGNRKVQSDITRVSNKIKFIPKTKSNGR